MDETKITAVLILDIVGKPKEYLVQSLEKHIANMEKEPGVAIKSKNIKEPELLKGEKDFYTTFAEVEVEAEEILKIVSLMFKYMPAHVEIISPETFVTSNNILNDTLNELVRRLHSYDELARIMHTEKQILIRKIQELGGEIPEGIMPLTVLEQPFEEVGADGEQEEPKKSKKKKKE